jgi:predicted DNA-binding transcriptional regulator AlpA
MSKVLLREPQVLKRMGVGRTKLNDDYIKTGRLRWVRLGPRIKALPDDEVDAVIAEEIAARDAAPSQVPKVGASPASSSAVDPTPPKGASKKLREPSVT